MSAKYYFLEQDKQTKLYRIRALRDFGDVKAGDIGGFVQSEDNLSHDGDCWVHNDAQVQGNARVFENAKIFHKVRINGNSQISGSALVCNNARVYENARVYGNACVHGRALVCGNAWVYGKAEIFGTAKVYEDALVYGNARVYENASVLDNARVYENAQVYGNAEVHGEARIHENVRVHGNARVYRDEKVAGRVQIFSNKPKGAGDMDKKYELLEQDTQTGLYRIRALRDFGDVNAGDIGGYVQSEDNLSHEGNCWVYDDAQVQGKARVEGNSQISGSALVCNNARVYENARVYGNACVHGRALVCGNAHVYDNAQVYGEVTVYGNARVCGDNKGSEKTPTPVATGSTKHDDKKPRPELIPADVLVKVAEVLADGARRYGARNWSEGGGFQWSRLQGATMRHLLKFASGVDKDPDSGLDHLAHGICSLMFLYAHQLRNLGTDDRDKTERKIED